jgi:hypothetical protein
LARSSLCFLCAFVSLWLSAASEYQQQNGPATICIDAAKNEAGQLEIALSRELGVTVRIEGSASLQVAPLASPPSSLDWQLSRKTEPERVPLPGGRTRWQQTLRFYPQKTGELTFQSAPLRYREAPGGERWQEVIWKPIPIRVTTEIFNADLSELRDISPPEELPPGPSWRVPILGAVLAVIVVIGIIICWEVLHGRPSPGATLSPAEWAFREIDRIGVLDRSSAKEVEQFHTLLCDVVRRYLELRFRLPAPEQTTAEFLETMSRSPQLTAADQDQLSAFLKRCDLVKFARAFASPEECAEMLATARGFVESSAPEMPGVRAG